MLRCTVISGQSDLVVSTLFIKRGEIGVVVTYAQTRLTLAFCLCQTGGLKPSNHKLLTNGWLAPFKGSKLLNK